MRAGTGRAATLPAAVVIGRPGGPREEAARRLRAATPALTWLDHPGHLARMPRVQARGSLPPGAAVVLVAEPYLPGLITTLSHGHRARTLAASYASAARTAHDLSAGQLVVCSTAFLYPDDKGRPLQPTAPTDPRAETVAAHAAEGAAHVFAALGGRSVILRLGWVFGDHDPITARVRSAARNGWRLIDGEPAAWVAALSAGDAAGAIHAAAGAPPGIYNIADARPATQADIHAALQEAAGTVLHPAYDPYWGESGTLFGASRRLDGTSFTQHTGWRPAGPGISQYLRERLR